MAESHDADFSINSKKDSMNLDCHLEASIMADLIEDFKGASNFINDRPVSGQVTSTFVWTGLSEEEYYDDFENFDFRFLLPDGKDEQKPEATHLVVSVVYGAQAYCVFSQDLNGKQGLEETRKKAQETLSNLTKKFWAAIDRKLDVASFKKELDTKEKHQLTRFNCRLYSDLQAEPVRQCNIFDAYKNIMELRELVFNFVYQNDLQQLNLRNAKQIVPIAIKICPLKVLSHSVGQLFRSRMLQYDDIDDKLVEFCCRLLANLNRISIQAEDLSNSVQYAEDCLALREFAKTVSQYENVLRAEFKTSVIAGRRSNSHCPKLAAVATKGCNHPLFKLLKLEKWLKCKQSEIDMRELMASKSDTTSITFLPNRNQLQRHLSINKKNALVLVVPPLDEKTNSILDVMKKCCDELDADSGEIKDDVTLPWHMFQARRNIVLDHIRELAVHVEKNQNFLIQIQFLVTFGEIDQPFDCNYSIYKDGKLLKNNVRRLPDPPSGLRIHSVTRKVQQTQISSIGAEWDYEDLGYPCQFLVEYRPKGTSDPWIQQRTIEPNQNTLTFVSETDSTLEFRVAAETVIGRSDFSDTFTSSQDDEDSSVAKKKLKKEEVVLPCPANLKVKSVIGTTVELEWTPSPQAESHRVVYWKEGENPSTAKEKKPFSCDTSCWLEDLEPETTYQFQVTARYESQETSQPSETFEYTTNKEVRLVELLVDKCEKTGNENGLDLYQLPLVCRETEDLTFAESFLFDTSKNTGLPESFRPNITILLVGTSDSGKSSLINSFVNFTFGVDLEDPFRFQLVDQSQDDSQSRIRVYNIQRISKLRTGCSLTIIDTPSYSEDNDPAQNREITEMIRKFFDDRDRECIQEADLVGFVMDSSAPCLTPLQLYIYSSLISIFGNQIKENINFLLTSADEEDPYFWDDVVDSGLVTYGPLQPQQQSQHKFNSSIYFCSGPDIPECFTEWRENFSVFFSSLFVASRKCVSLLRQLEDEKVRLETVVEELAHLLKVRVDQLEELERWKLKFNGHTSQRTLEFNTIVKDKNKLPFGDYVTNCNKCQVTCHTRCGVQKKKKFDCEVMDHSMPKDVRTCRVCLGKCSWEVHANQPFKWEFSQGRTSLDAIKERYDTKLNKTLTSEELRKILDEEMEMKMEESVEKIESTLGFIQQINAIAKYLDPDCATRCGDIIGDVSEYIHRLLQFEKWNDKNDENIDRLKGLLRAANVAGNGEFSSDEDDFDEDLFDYEDLMNEMYL